jgi:hypothetical protein
MVARIHLHVPTPSLLAELPAVDSKDSDGMQCAMGMLLAVSSTLRRHLPIPGASRHTRCGSNGGYRGTRSIHRVVASGRSQRRVGSNDREAIAVDLREPMLSSSFSSDAYSGEPTTASAASLCEAKREASDRAEREFLERGLQEVGGTVTELARRCDMNRSHVQMLLKKHGLKSKDFRAPARGAA